MKSQLLLTNCKSNRLYNWNSTTTSASFSSNSIGTIWMVSISRIGFICKINKIKWNKKVLGNNKNKELKLQDATFEFFLLEGRKLSAQCPKMIYKNMDFSKKLFSSSCSYGRVEFSSDNPVRKTSTTPPKKVRKEAGKFSPNVRKKIKQKSSFEKVIFSPKNTYEHKECSFDNPTKLCFTSRRKYLAQFPKMVFENMNFQNILFFPKILVGTKGQVECSFDNPYKKAPTKSEKYSAHCPKLIQKIWFSHIIYFSSKGSPGQLCCSYDNSAEKNIDKRPESLSSMSEK